MRSDTTPVCWLAERGRDEGGIDHEEKDTKKRCPYNNDITTEL